MADDDLPPPIRLMNFVSQEQLDEAKKNRGARVEDGTAQRDRPLYEILRENKDKKDAEFNERFKHRPPKALDEDETEFLDNLEMSRREYERQMANEEAQQLQNFQAAVAAQAILVHELKETPPVPKVQEPKFIGRKNPPPRGPLGMTIKVKPQSKKAKMNHENSVEFLEVVKTSNGETKKDSESESANTGNGNGDRVKSHVLASLVSYGDESDEDDD